MKSPKFTIDYSSINAVKAKVELYNGSTLVKTCTCSDNLQNFSVSRVGESGKFFGYYICQQLKITLIDLEREIEVEKGQLIRVAYGVDGIPEEDFFYPHPDFFAEEITRNEDTNSLEIIAYDAFYNANKIKFLETEEINEPISYNPKNITCTLNRCLNALGIPTGITISRVIMWVNKTFTNEPNFDENTTLADVLKAYAQVRHGVLYLERDGARIQGFYPNGEADLTITKDQYFSLKTGRAVTLDGLAHVTELGDNVGVGATEGTIQYIRENPWWENNPEEMVGDLEAIWEKRNGDTIQEFECEDWIGNIGLQICDKIAFETEDGGYVYSYLLDDTITFDGTLSQATRWSAEMADEETATNPSTLGEKLNQTYAKVDKANRKINLVANDVNGQGERLSNLEISTQGISATVTTIQTSTETAIGTINDNFETLSKQVSAKVSADDVQITIESEMKKGVDKVQTSTGFTFNDEGLKVSKSGSEMTTQITEDGMAISRGGQETLVADNTGVKAENLHATTYLIIGETSRFEDYGSDRTGCFWIGG